MVDENSSLAEIRAFFADDKFATGAQCSILEARAGHAVCEMPITPNHLNMRGQVMGGATFTLADFTMAVMSNLDRKPSVAIDCNIRYFTTAKGTKLIATGNADRAGRSVGFYTVDVEDNLGNRIAQFVSTAHRSPEQPQE
jgi:acyl-CoA thioesterase